MSQEQEQGQGAGEAGKLQTQAELLRMVCDLAVELEVGGMLMLSFSPGNAVNLLARQTGLTEETGLTQAGTVAQANPLWPGEMKSIANRLRELTTVQRAINQRMDAVTRRLDKFNRGKLSEERISDWYLAQAAGLPGPEAYWALIAPRTQQPTLDVVERLECALETLIAAEVQG